MKKYFPETLICLFIIALGISVFAQLGGYGYILYDDMMSIYDPFFADGLSFKKIGQAFYSPSSHLPYQVPVPVIGRLALWELFGDNLGKHHLCILFFHLLCALLLFGILRSTTKETVASGFCALLFTVHPLNVEPVSWLAGFNGMLEAFFLLAGLACYAFYVNKPSFKRYLLVFLPFLLGLMSKPTIAVFPFLLLLFDFWPLQRFSLRLPQRGDIICFLHNKILLEKIPLIVLVPIQIKLGELMISGRIWHEKPVSLSFYPGSIVDFVLHLRKVIVPTGLTICRPEPPDAALWAAIGSLSVLMVICVFLLKKAGHHRYLITGWFWFLIASAPALVMVAFSGRPVEDRHLYIPLIGLLIMFSFSLSGLMENHKCSRFLSIITIVMVITPLFLLAHRQTSFWQNSITVFNHALSIDPENKRAHVNLGDTYMTINKTDKALEHYRQFLRLSKGSALAYTKLADALKSANRAEESIRHYQKALALSPDYVPAYHGLADLMIDMGKTDRAISLYRKALSINPGLFQTHNNLALALYEQGHFQEACKHLNQAVRINPDYHTAARNLQILINAKIQSSTCPPPEPGIER